MEAFPAIITVGATTWGARYALRVFRSAVVSLSLTPRNGI